ncbi:MAG: phosphocholine cytidylyltransferase family protein [Chloroflexi bacterium]|nr:phosphocholine cytidylyltransferase family protein [Chloroflexota bacterium]
MKGLILAAGMGTRLFPLTRTRPKCLVHVAGRPMMEYQLDSLRRAGIHETTIVIGHMADAVRDHFGSNYRGVNISYVENADYDKTNNLYSLWLAREEFNEGILLIESDLVFDDLLVWDLLMMKAPNLAIVDYFQPTMDGTVIMAEDGVAKQMVLKSDQGPEFDYSQALKTVNIYRLCKETLVETIVPKMEEFLDDDRSDMYYEAVFADLIESGCMKMAAMNTGNRKWAEIDTLDDLRDAERMFAAAAVG